MIFPNIFKTYSVRHYAVADRNKVVLGVKMGTLDEIRITLSIKKFKSLLDQLNKINDSLNGDGVSSAQKDKKTK